VDAGSELTDVFSYLDLYGSIRCTAEVVIELANTECLTIRAGGAGTHSLPAGASGPYTCYEVLLDHEPARFWTKYGHEDSGVLYAEVPRLLITHHIVRRGGIGRMALETRELLTGTFTVSILSDSDAVLNVAGTGMKGWQALEGIKDISLVGRHFVAQD
jgi:hypothetical protein